MISSKKTHNLKLEKDCFKNLIKILSKELPESPYKYQLLGLNLLCLLANNHLAEFHTVNNTSIKFKIKI